MRENIRKWLFLIVSVGILTFGGCCLLLLPQSDFSESENRYLTKFEPITLKGFLDASVQENLTNASNDQFLGRDTWMKFATACKRAIGNQDAGGVYFGKDGYYFERVMDSDISVHRYENNLQYVEKLAENTSIPTSVLLAPSAGTVLGELLPANAVLYDADNLYEIAQRQLKEVSLLNIKDALRQEAENGEQVYFKTDHHWTTYGAYQAYAAYCRAEGMEPKARDSFGIFNASDAFYGTLYSKAPGFWTKPDKLCMPKEPAVEQVIIDGKEQGSIYVQDKLQVKDKYGVYFGGNFGNVTIRTGSESKKKLLIIKDSFANSFVPYLTEAYGQIQMLDMRYDNESVQSQIQEFEPDAILVLYEMSNFAQDMNLFKILK